MRLEFSDVDGKLNRLYEYMDRYTYNQATWDHLIVYWSWFVNNYQNNLNEAWLTEATTRLDEMLAQAEEEASHYAATYGSSMQVIHAFRQTFKAGKQERNEVSAQITHGRGIFNYIRVNILREQS